MEQEYLDNPLVALLNIKNKKIGFVLFLCSQSACCLHGGLSPETEIQEVSEEEKSRRPE